MRKIKLLISDIIHTRYMKRVQKISNRKNIN